jgi:hypothetical protein
MAEIDIETTLHSVREAERSVTAALRQSGLTQNQRDLLDELAETLRDLDNQLALGEISTKTAEFERKAVDMARLDQKTQVELQKLQKVAAAVEKAAQAVNARAKVFGVLVKTGLV